MGDVPITILNDKLMVTFTQVPIKDSTPAGKIGRMPEFVHPLYSSVWNVTFLPRMQYDSTGMKKALITNRL